jgi:hypothetical protein
VAKLDWLTYDHFDGRVGEPFEVSVGDGPAVSMELVDASVGTELGGPGPDGEERLQFSLVFQGPATQLLPQGTYRLAHAELGELELFLVPIGRDADGTRYEAAFA